MNSITWTVRVQNPELGAYGDSFSGPDDPVAARRLAEALQRQNRIVAGAIVDLYPANGLSPAERFTRAIEDESLSIYAYRALLASDTTGGIVARHPSWGEFLRVRLSDDGTILDKRPLAPEDRPPQKTHSTRFVASGEDAVVSQTAKDLNRVDPSWLSKGAAEALAALCGPELGLGITALYLDGECRGRVVEAYRGKPVRTVGVATGVFTADLNCLRDSRRYDTHAMTQDLKRLILAAPGPVRSAVESWAALPARRSAWLREEMVFAAARPILAKPRPDKNRMPALYPGEKGFTPCYA